MNRNTEENTKILERKNYNLKHNYKEGKPKEFKHNEIICSSCGIYSSDDSGKDGAKYLGIKDLKGFQCSQCDNHHCSRCVIDAEFKSNHVKSKVKFVDPFIEKGKVCFHCLDSVVDRIDLGRLLKANNVLVKDEDVLALEKDNDMGYNF